MSVSPIEHREWILPVVEPGSEVERLCSQGDGWKNVFLLSSFWYFLFEGESYPWMMVDGAWVYQRI
jgi:hypothetical protein